MPPKLTTNWINEVNSRIRSDMADANADMIRRVLYGMGPDKSTRDAACGAHVAMNIAAVYVPSFCNPKPGQKAYKNTHDLGTTPSLEDIPRGAPIPNRTLVDSLIETVAQISPKEIYYGAVEVNGSGIRFYGDFCFILKPDIIEDDTVVLMTNSYDLVRPPMTPAGSSPDVCVLEPKLRDMSGLWKDDTPEMAVLKTFLTRNISERRLTTGQISEAILEDEDYMEVLKVGTFNATGLQEVRVSAAEAANEAHISEKLRLGPCPTLSELQWRKHRRAAVRALQQQGIRTRVVTTSGRIRT